MLLSEWEYAVKDHKIAEERHSYRYCSVCQAIVNNPTVAYSVACVFYASKKLDSVPGINGLDRHKVLVRWLHEHPLQFTTAITAITEAMYDACRKELSKLTQELSKLAQEL